MLRNNKYYYEDRYMYFTFNGIHSSKYNLFIQNKNDLKIENTIGAKSSFVSAAFQEGNYYTGTERTQKTIKRKCAAEGLTLSQYKEMMKWLSAGDTGFLSFDSDPYWGWTVVLDTVGDATFLDRSGGLVVEFELTFKTIGTYLARNRYPAYVGLDEASVDDLTNTSTCNNRYNTTPSCNEYGIPVIYYEMDENGIKNNTYFIQSINNVHQHLNFSYSGKTDEVTELKIEYRGTPYIDLKTKQFDDTKEDINFVIDYLGESNLILADNTIVELRDELLDYNYQGEGILQLSSDAPIELKSVKVEDGQIFIEDYNELYYLLLNNIDYICFTKIKEVDKTATYGDSRWNRNSYPIQYETYLFFVRDEYKSYTAGLQNTLDVSENYSEYFVNSNIINVSTDSAVNSTTTLSDGSGANITSTPLFMNNDMLEQDIDWSSFKCYAGKTQQVKITCTNAVDNTEHITVVSCNNL